MLSCRKEFYCLFLIRSPTWYLSLNSPSNRCSLHRFEPTSFIFTEATEITAGGRSVASHKNSRKARELHECNWIDCKQRHKFNEGPPIGPCHYACVQRQGYLHPYGIYIQPVHIFQGKLAVWDEAISLAAGVRFGQSRDLPFLQVIQCILARSEESGEQ